MLGSVELFLKYIFCTLWRECVYGSPASTGFSVIMFLQYYLNEQGDRVYTLKKLDPTGQQTCSAHPARFSPDDKYSRHRITIKKRFKVLMTQQPRPVL